MTIISIATDCSQAESRTKVRAESVPLSEASDYELSKLQTAETRPGRGGFDCVEGQV
jgi:hypothetical protein